MRRVHASSSLKLAVGLLAAAVVAGRVPAGAQTADVEQGRALFAEKHCARCHLSRGQEGVGPPFDELRRPQGAWELAGRLWNHAPAMFTALNEKGIEWPQISTAEMAALMAYLEADPARDAAPDLFKGEVALVRKGCLKCHSLRREGARIAPDLATERADYDSAVAWATAMWIHTPRMAVKAREVGVLYPRFAGDELDNLVGFLRSVAK